MGTLNTALCIASFSNLWHLPSGIYEYFFKVEANPAAVMANSKLDYSYLRAKVQYYFYYIDILMTAFLTIFQRFSITVRRFPKIFQNCSEGQMNFSEHFRNVFLEISKHCRKLSRKTRRCFDHTPTNLSTVSDTNLISVKSSISSLVRIRKIRHSSPGCSFVC